MPFRAARRPNDLMHIAKLNRCPAFCSAFRISMSSLKSASCCNHISNSFLAGSSGSKSLRQKMPTISTSSL